MDPIILDALRLALQRRRYDFGGQVEWSAPKEPEPVKQPDEEEQEKFLKEQLEGSAPQYEPEAGLKTAKEAGLMAAGFAPGSGIASAAGAFPTAEGGFEPSLREDISAGRYGSAALKGVGAAGDIVSAVPVVGTALGTAMKAPLALKLATAMAPAAKIAREAAPAAKAAEEVAEAAPAYQRLVNPAGFYSRAHEVAMTELPDQPRTWQEMHSLLSKAPRVQKEELYWSGIHPETFAPDEKVSREQIAELIKKNFPMVEPEIRAEKAKSTPKYEQYTVPGGTDYEERILRHQYVPTKHPDAVAKYEPEIKAVTEELDRLLRSKNEYQETVVDPYIRNIREEYIQKRLSGDTPVTTPEELAAAKEARDVASVMRDRASTEYLRLLEGGGSTQEIAAAKQNAAMSHEKYKNLEEQYLGLYKNSEKGIRADISQMIPQDIANVLGKDEEFSTLKSRASDHSTKIEDMYNAQKVRLDALRDKVLEESRRLLLHTPAYTQRRYTTGHWDDTTNPVVHTRNTTRTGPEGEKIWHQEEIQSDWAQQGRERGFQPEPLSSKEKKELDELMSRVGPDSSPEDKARYQELSARDVGNMTKSGIPRAPYTRDTEHWLELAAKDTLKEAIERGYDKIFITGGQEQAKRWANELRQAVDSVRWEPSTPSGSRMSFVKSVQDKISMEEFGKPYEELSGKNMDVVDRLTLSSKKITKEELDAVADAYEASWDLHNKIWDELTPSQQESVYAKLAESGKLPKAWGEQPVQTGERIVYAQPKGSGAEHRFVVRPVTADGKVRYQVVDSSIPKAKGETLSSVIGGDLAKRVMAEESGNVPMKGYVMGSEGYTQTYERKAPSIYKKLLKSLDPEAKVEAGPLHDEYKVQPEKAFSEEFLKIVAPLKDKFNDEDAQRIFGKSMEDLTSDQQREVRFASLDRMAQIAKEKGIPVHNKPPVHGTFITITPKMRAEYNRLKQKYGAVFPAYKRGGTVDANVNASYNDRQRRLVKDALKITRRYTD